MFNLEIKQCPAGVSCPLERSALTSVSGVGSAPAIPFAILLPEVLAVSNGSPLDESSFRLPSGEEVEVAFVRLEDGRIVARTKEELELLERASPASPAPEAPE